MSDSPNTSAGNTAPTQAEQEPQNNKSGLFINIIELIIAYCKRKRLDFQDAESRRIADRRFITKILEEECEPSFLLLIEAGHTGGNVGQEAKQEVEPASPSSNAEAFTVTASNAQATAEKNGASNPKKTGAYAVYIRSGFNVVCITKGAANTSTSEQNSIHALAAQLNALPVDKLFEPHKIAFKRMVGQIYVSAIKNEIESGKLQYAEALQYYKKRNVETFRLWQITFATGLYAVLVALLLWWAGLECLLPPDQQYGTTSPCCPCWESTPQQPQEHPLLVIPMMIASLAGSFYTIVKNAGKNERDAESSKWLIFCDCCARAIVAIILGAAAWCLLFSDFAPQPFHEFKHLFYSALVIAFAAGLIEKFIPSLICKAMPTDNSAGKNNSLIS